MRIMIKGGVWKNTEDEILKAAVMKYGKNQWARISSLLVRKSAKQCKARWYEWLDPSIKKTEWTREEDEKLLHLAKLMPTQWRTIAPIVGRTPSQCLERYEKLLDAACSKDENYEPGDDPRKLRPGEIDPNPESKPARPDPVDMDEDEKEMLSEARARLANTRGKKAKRKAREKQLEEARRLASLQKRRELKAAGINTRLRRRKRRGIDYNAEIPFEKRPPPGFYDVVDEDRPIEQPKFPTTIEELEGKRRADIEAQQRKQDIARNKIAQRQDAPSAILQANKLNDPEAVRKRSRLMLPSPQISDQELEEIAKMGYAGDLVLGNEELAEGSGATHALLANYSQTPRQGMTPMRTPQRTPAGKADAIMMEAENLARLRESQTPLLGGENPELHPSDFSGVTPRKREIQTPNIMATPVATPGHTTLTPRLGMTPSRDGFSYGLTPKGTPFRDELHINEDVEVQDVAKLELRRQAELRKNLRSGFSNLPQPNNEYQIVAPPNPEENEEIEEKIEEDMSDRIAREKAQEQARQEALLKKRSKVLQRQLPRPPAASLQLIRNLLMRVGEDKSSFVPPTLFEQADEMVNKELLALLEHDNAKYPQDEKAEKEKKKGTKRTANGKSSISVPEIEDFEDDELKEADSLIKEEIQFLRVAMGHESESMDDFSKARDACQEDIMYFPSRNTYGLASIAGNSEKLAALQNEFEIVKKRMDDEARKATKLEHKIKVLTQGYQTRGGKLWSQIEATNKQVDTAATELECFQALHKQELLSSSYRVNTLIEEVNKQKILEQSQQHRYGNLFIEHDSIQRLLEEHKEKLRIQEEIAAKNRALEEEIAAKNRAIEEEIAAKNRALEEEIAAKNRAIEEEIAAKNRAIEEETAAKKLALEEDTALEEETTVNNRAVEEISTDNHAIEEEITVEKSLVEEQVQKTATLEEESVSGSCTPGEDKITVEKSLHEEQVAQKNAAVEEDSMARSIPGEDGITVEKSLDVEQVAQKNAAVEQESMARSCIPGEDEITVEKSLDVEQVAQKDAAVEEESMARSCIPGEDEITVEKSLDEEQVAQKNAAVEEESAARSCTPDERLVQNNQYQNIDDSVDICVPESGQIQASILECDDAEGVALAETVPSVGDAGLRAENCIEKIPVAPGQTTAELVLETNDDKEKIPILGTDTSLPVVVAGHVDEDNMIVDDQAISGHDMTVDVHAKSPPTDAVISGNPDALVENSGSEDTLQAEVCSVELGHSRDDTEMIDAAKVDPSEKIAETSSHE